MDLITSVTQMHMTDHNQLLIAALWNTLALCLLWVNIDKVNYRLSHSKRAI